MLWILRVMLVLLPGLALAQDMRPAEKPPADFLARQYIDSRGCVFLRDPGGGWQVRVARDGAPICGYPPTLSARGLDGRPRLRALDPDAGRSRAELLEEALSQAVITQVRPSELASDPQPMAKLPDMGPEPAASGPAKALRAAIAAAPAVRQGMGGGLKPNLRLCELLGYNGQAGPGRLGGDPSQGYCDSLPDADLARLSFMRPVGSIAEAPASVVPMNAGAPQVETVKKAMTDPDPGGGTKAAVVAASPAQSAAAQARPVAVGKGQTDKRATARAAAVKRRPESPSVGMIPAGARYVQLGTFGNRGNADRAAQRAAGLGYPVLRGTDHLNGREVQFIMAGPFKDRESIVRALDALRRAGYGDAFPR